MISKIKKIFYDTSLKQAVKKATKFQREMINIDDSKTVGIIFDATKTHEVITVSNFADKLRNMNKEVYILGFQDRKLKGEEDERLFDRNSVNWYGVPNEVKVDQFQSISLDILICAFKEECLPLEYIAATSKAKFRVGAFSKNKTNFYELMINIKEEQNLLYLLQQTLHFLKVINRND